MSALDILIIDDEPAIRQLLATHIERAGHTVSQCGDGNAALERLARGGIDVALCDIQMPELSGLELLRRARGAGIDTSFIMMTAYASVDTAIEAIKTGAADYMIKPLRNEEVMYRLQKAGDERRLRDENQALRRLVHGKSEAAFHFCSPAMRELERLVAKIAPSDGTVLITGESGTGKGVVAQQIHRVSQRCAAPFVSVNCGAFPEHLIESELFGHLKGAFTGADKVRKGLFMEAERGTLFLDEIGELPLTLQVKLLHVLEDKLVRPVGAEQARRVDVRIVAATNRDLAAMVREGRFREDLYFRLCVFQLHIPPLRERRQDIDGLVRFFLRRGEARTHGGAPFTLAPEVEELFEQYDWPGNVREMENVVNRALILAEQGCVTRADLPPQFARLQTTQRGAGWAPPGGTLREQMRRLEAELICNAIAEAGGDRRLAAHSLGIGLSSLYRKLEEMEGLEDQRPDSAAA